jgi:hypothetical protein
VLPAFSIETLNKVLSSEWLVSKVVFEQVYEKIVHCESKGTVQIKATERPIPIAKTLISIEIFDSDAPDQGATILQ